MYLSSENLPSKEEILRQRGISLTSVWNSTDPTAGGIPDTNQVKIIPHGKDSPVIVETGIVPQPDIFFNLHKNVFGIPNTFNADWHQWSPYALVPLFGVEGN